MLNVLIYRYLFAKNNKEKPVLQDINTKVFTLLFSFSILTIAALHLGIGNTQLSLISGDHVNTIEAIKSRNFKSTLEQNGAVVSSQCSLLKVVQYDFCGVIYGLGLEGHEYGLDLEKYDSITLSLKYSAPLKSSKLKVILRNYDPQYSKPDDSVSLKFNSISINPRFHESKVTIPLNAFQVDAWWISQYEVGFDNSQLDLKNIAFLEINTENILAIGDYKITIEEAVLNGKVISETELFKVLLLIWLVCTVLLVTAQRNKLKILSITDPLTGLYNRRGIRLWINKYLSSQSPNDNLTMIYIDIDDFKKVNDTYGHATGDQLLSAFSTLINQLLSIEKNSTMAFSRLSGDEFTILFKDDMDGNLDTCAKKLLLELKKPLQLGNQEIIINVSIGIAKADKDISTFEDLLLRADSAMYYAKKSGKNQYKIFDKSIAKDLFFRKQTAEKIKNAIIQDQFHLNYMPILDSKSLEIVSVELLIRCHAESLKGIGPDVFIPIAEEYDLIKSIDLWVIEACFKQIAKERNFLAQRDMVFCINISALELHNFGFSKKLENLIKLYQITPSSIELEITETSLVETDEMSIQTLLEIRALGVKLALDDFGTGYTAFSQLINYPVNCLKIDKSFIDGLESHDNTQATMIRAIIAIAKSYHLTTIAEGIETASQYELLANLGCDMMQGYLFAKPMPWSDFKNTLIDPDDSLQADLLTHYPKEKTLKSD